MQGCDGGARKKGVLAISLRPEPRLLFIRAGAIEPSLLEFDDVPETSDAPPDQTRRALRRVGRVFLHRNCHLRRVELELLRGTEGEWAFRLSGKASYRNSHQLWCPGPRRNRYSRPAPAFRHRAPPSQHPALWLRKYPAPRFFRIAPVFLQKCRFTLNMRRFQHPTAPFSL